MADPKAEAPALAKRLGVFDATTILVGSMIGSGIFVAPSIMAGWVPSPGLLVGLWVFGGLFTVLGALAYAELATMFPHAGGQYVYLREAFGPFWAFLFGWTLLFVIQTGFIAAVSIGFAKFLGYFVPSLGEARVLVDVPLLEHAGDAVPSFLRRFQISTAQIVASGVIALLTAINVRGVREAAVVQNLFTVAKVLALAGLVLVGLSHLGSSGAHFRPLFSAAPGKLAIAAGAGFGAALAVAMSKALFAYDAWNTVTFVAEEVREPARSLPRALVGGSVLVMIVYVLTNVSYVATIPVDAMAAVPENKIGEAVATRLFGGAGAVMIVIAILVSTFGCANGLVLGGARVAYAMAREGLFFAPCAKLHARRGTPAAALVLQGAWACVLTLSGSYDALLTYTTFASVLFAALTVFAVIRLRATRPDAPRAYRCWGYPATPLLYLAIALPFLAYVIQGDPVATGIGAALIATGVPAYLAWRKRAA